MKTGLNNPGKNKTDGEKVLIKKVDDWVGEAIMKERCKEKVFTSKDRATVTSKICGIPISEAFNLRKCQGEMQTKKRGRPKIELDELDQRALSRLVLGFYRRQPSGLPALDKIHKESQEIPGIPKASKSTIQRRLKKLGFVCKKRNKKVPVYQRLDVVANRQKVLPQLRELRALIRVQNLLSRRYVV